MIPFAQSLVFEDLMMRCAEEYGLCCVRATPRKILEEKKGCLPWRAIIAEGDEYTFGNTPREALLGAIEYHELPASAKRRRERKGGKLIPLVAGTSLSTAVTDAEPGDTYFVPVADAKTSVRLMEYYDSASSGFATRTEV